MASNNILAKILMAAYEMWKMLEQSLIGQLTYSSIDLSQSGQSLCMSKSVAKKRAAAAGAAVPLEVMCIT